MVRTNWYLLNSLDGRDVFANLDGSTNDFVTNAQRERSLAPASSDRVHVGAADTAALNGNVNVTVLKGLELELDWRSAMQLGAKVEKSGRYLLLLEVGPFLLVADHKALGSLWVRHLEVISG